MRLISTAGRGAVEGVEGVCRAQQPARPLEGVFFLLTVKAGIGNGGATL